MAFCKILPVEIALDIFSRVPSAESILDCKLVCTSWNNLVHHPSFAKMHLDRLNHPSTIDSGKLGFLAVTNELDDYDELFNILRVERFPVKNGQLHYFEYSENHDQSTTPINIITRIHFPVPFSGTCFVGSCNGLICLSRGPCYDIQNYKNVCICNPITREFVLLPVIKRDCNTDQHISWTCGFGSSFLTNEYKVVALYMYKTHYVEVYIYTLGSGSGWRNLGKFNSQFSTLKGRQGIFANGALYWMGANLDMILTFDLAAEKFREHLSPPPLPEENIWCINRIGVLDGFLYFAIGLVTEGDYCNEIWILKNKIDDDDVKERKECQSLGWSNEFRFDERGKILAVTKSGSVLTYIDNYLINYDPTASSSKILVNYTELFCQAVPHKNTLVSLKELGEEDARIIESSDLGEREP